MSSQPGSHTADADIPNKAQQEAPQGKKENIADVCCVATISTVFKTDNDQARAPGHLAGVEGKSVRTLTKRFVVRADHTSRPTTLLQITIRRPHEVMRRMEARLRLFLRNSRRSCQRVWSALCRMFFTIREASKKRWNIRKVVVVITACLLRAEMQRRLFPACKPLTKRVPNLIYA